MQLLSKRQYAYGISELIMILPHAAVYPVEYVYDNYGRRCPSEKLDPTEMARGIFQKTQVRQMR